MVVGAVMYILLTKQVGLVVDVIMQVQLVMNQVHQQFVLQHNFTHRHIVVHHYLEHPHNHLPVRVQQ